MAPSIGPSAERPENLDHGDLTSQETNETSDTTNLAPPTQCSNWKTTLMARAAAMKGLPHVSRTKQAVNEVRMSAKHTHKENMMHLSPPSWTTGPPF